MHPFPNIATEIEHAINTGTLRITTDRRRSYITVTIYATIRHQGRIHFGLIVTINLGIGQQTPPVASVLMTCCAIAKADMWEVTKVNVYFVAVLLAVLILVTYVPVTGMGLVDLFYR